MIEPTESEDKIEMDRFIDALKSIRQEIREIEEGVADKQDNVLKNAPHTLKHIITGDWTHPYSREKAAYPSSWVHIRGKLFPSVGRVDAAYGEKNMVCTCPDIMEYFSLAE